MLTYRCWPGRGILDFRSCANTTRMFDVQHLFTVNISLNANCFKLTVEENQQVSNKQTNYFVVEFVI